MIIEYIRCKDMKEGDVLARTLYTDKDRILLRAGNTLTKRSIDTITQTGFKGVYIENELVDRRVGIEIPEPLISDLECFCVVDLCKKIIHKSNIIKDRACPMFYTYRKDLEDRVDDFVDLFFEYEQQDKLIFETEDTRTFNTWLSYHSLNTCLLSMGMAIKMGLDRKTVYEIALGGLYHDIGKLFVDWGLVNKLNPSDAELKEIRKHCEHGKILAQHHNFSLNTTYAIWQHHEREDGSGYPKRLRSDKIQLSAKIVGLASYFDNMVNYNPFNNHAQNLLTQKDALEKLYADERFDKTCVRALNKFVSPYPIGTKVKLSNGKQGIVIRNKAGQPLRPTVLCGRAEVLNLAEDTNLLNVVVLD